VEFTVGFWAVHAVGAVAVLANVWWSEDELAEAFGHFEPTLVLCDDEGRRRLPGGLSVCSFEEIRARVADRRDGGRVVMPAVAESDPAIVIFTSGSTGAARGVVLSQRAVIANLQNLLVATKRLPGLLDDDYDPGVNLLSVPMFHLSGVQVLGASLLTGARLVYQPGRFDAGEVIRLIEAERVSTWGAVPAMVTRVIEHPDVGSHDLGSVRSIPLGGSAASAGFLARVRAAFPHLKGGSAGSLYGFTEAGGVIAMGSGRDLAEHPGAVGRLLPIAEARIVHPNDAGDGSILVRSPAVMSGFVNGDPAPVDEDGWIDSGDVGHLGEDGLLYVTGRTKDIIIRGGENISCVHVENALISHPAVAEVLAVSLPHAELGEQVGAVVCLRPDAVATVEELREYAARRLGRFQIPTRWWLRRALLPTNPQGKIIRGDVRAQWLARGGEDLEDLTPTA
jgi:long-chain acyl-CoA synthetase